MTSPCVMFLNLAFRIVKLTLVEFTVLFLINKNRHNVLKNATKSLLFHYFFSIVR